MTIVLGWDEVSEHLYEYRGGGLVLRHSIALDFYNNPYIPFEALSTKLSLAESRQLILQTPPLEVVRALQNIDFIECADCGYAKSSEVIDLNNICEDCAF